MFTHSEVFKFVHLHFLSCFTISSRLKFARKLHFQFSFSLIFLTSETNSCGLNFAQINVCGEALVCDTYYLVQTSIYFNFGRAFFYNSQVCVTATLLAYFTVQLLSSFSVCDIIAYAVTECTVVHGISVELVCVWFGACLTYLHMSTCSST